MTTRDEALARMRSAAAAVPDETLAQRHEAKLAEMARLAADIHEARVAMLQRARDAAAAEAASPEALQVSAEEPQGQLQRVTGLLREPTRLATGLARRAGTARRRVSRLRSAVGRHGGPRRAARTALGLLLRDGPTSASAQFLGPDPDLVPEPPRLLEANPPWYSVDAPEVSVVVLNWNKAEMTLECVESLWQHTSGYPYEIVVVDNGSREDDAAHFDRIVGPCRVVRVGVNRYFGEGNNIGVEAARGRFVVLLNNDVTVTSGWLEPLMQQILETADCGAAGPKFLYPDGLLQEAGGLLDDEGRSVQRGKFQDPATEEFNHTRTVDYVSAACCLVRKEDFVRVLGFDMMYEPAYYEDADLCMKLGQLGLRTVYVPQSVVVHHESVTTADTSHGLKLTNISELNRSKFVARWGSYLQTGRHAAPAAPIDVVECRRVPGRRTMGVYSPFDLTPGGGERYLFTLMSEALGHGLDVHFVTPSPYSRIRVTALASMFGVDVSGLCVTPLEEALTLPRFDDWIAMSNQLVPPIRAMGARNTLLCQFPFRAGVKEWRARDLWLSAYDRIVVYSDFAAGTVRQRLAEAHLPPMPVAVLTPAVEISERPIRAGKSGIVSTGRFFVGDHSKRQDLQIEAFKSLVRSGAAAGQVLHLVGSSSPEARHREFLLRCMEAAEGLDVQFHVDAPMATLDELYATSSVYWHSSGLGVDPLVEPERCEHFGIAPIEAMSYGTIPIVVGNGGPASTVRDGVDGFHYATIEELVDRTAWVLTRRADELVAMRESARARSHEFTRASFAAAAAELFDL